MWDEQLAHVSAALCSPSQGSFFSWMILDSRFVNWYDKVACKLGVRTNWVGCWPQLAPATKPGTRSPSPLQLCLKTDTYPPTYIHRRASTHSYILNCMWTGTPSHTPTQTQIPATLWCQLIQILPRTFRLKNLPWKKLNKVAEKWATYTCDR